MKTFYTYIYIDPETNVPFYVGKGFGGRAYTHLRRRDKHPMTNKIKALAKKGVAPIIQITDHLCEADALDQEKVLIASIGRRDLGLGPLLNLTDGGDGMSGYQMTQEHKNKIAMANRGKKVSAETRAKQSAVHKGKTVSAISRARLGSAVSGVGNGNTKFLTLRSPSGELIVQPSDKTAAEFCSDLGLRYPSLYKAFKEDRCMKGWRIVSLAKRS
jgi:hypothetical protein